MPAGPYRLPTAGRTACVRRDGGLERLLHVGGRAGGGARLGAGRAVRFRAEAAHARSPREGVERMRFALGVDHDLRRFHAPLPRATR